MTLTPESSNLVEHIRETERSRLSSLVAVDMVTADALHSPDFQLITPVGALLNKEQYLGAVSSGQIDYLFWEAGDIDVRIVGTVATIRYRADLEVVFGGHHVARSGYWHTDTYELGNGGWLAVRSQATAIRA